MKRLNLMVMLLGLAGLVVGQEVVPGAEVPLKEKSNLSGWRVSVGADYRFRYKTNLRMQMDRYNAAHPPFDPPQNAYPSRNEVLGRIGDGSAADDGRVYDNGEIGPDSGGGGYTWNWAADGMSQYHGDSQTVTFDAYYGVTEAQIGARTAPGVSDDKDLMGLKLDVAKELWRDGRFSLGVALGFSYYPERSLAASRQNFAAGTYRSERWRITDSYDVSGWGGIPPESAAGGGFSGPDNLLPYVPERSEGLDSVLADETFQGGAWVDIDMWLVEGRICLTPEWQMLDRLALLGNLGVALGYADITARSGSWMNQNNVTDSRSYSDDERKVLAQAILGLGLRFAVTDQVGLSVMAEARLPRTTIDIDAGPYKGDIETSVLSAGAQLDYFF